MDNIECSLLRGSYSAQYLNLPTDIEVQIHSTGDSWSAHFQERPENNAGTLSSVNKISRACFMRNNVYEMMKS